MPRHLPLRRLAPFLLTSVFSMLRGAGDTNPPLATDAISPPAIFDITRFGAIGDGKTLNTSAIQATIDKSAISGGGTVRIPTGDFLSGAIFLKPGVNLHLDKGAVLQGSTNIADYPEMETRVEGHFQVWIPALVNADGIDHLRLDGEGTIQGGGKPFWDAYLHAYAANKATKNLDVKRPRNIFIKDSTDVHVSGISLRQSGFWNLHLFRCRDVLVENVDIRSPLKAPSTDGIDLDSCQNVTITGCYISVDDDNICLKGSKGTSALDDMSIPPDENIHIANCTFGLGNAALTLGSEATTVRDVVMENCKLTGKEENCLIALKLRPDTEQDYENITVRNIAIDNPAAKLISLAPWKQYFDLQGKPAPNQRVNRLTLRDINGTLKSFGIVSRSDKGTVQNITFQNIELTLSKPAVVIKDINDIKFENVTINGQAYSSLHEAK